MQIERLKVEGLQVYAPNYDEKYFHANTLASSQDMRIFFGKMKRLFEKLAPLILCLSSYGQDLLI